MRHACCVGWFGTSTTATATPSAKAACPGASSSARTWGRTACGQWRSGCGRKGTSTASAASAGGPGPGRTGPAKGSAPSGASINVSMWDMIEKNFPEPGSERRLQGSSSASPGKEKRSAGDRKRDRKWREYQESLAAEAAQGAKGGTPAPSPQRANGGHHPGHATLGDFMEVAKQTRAKPRPLLLGPQQAPAGPSSDVESAHRVRMPADQASSSSSAAPAQRDVARACEHVCGVPCNLRVARQRATQRNAAVEDAVGIAHEEATEWGRGMDYHASKVAAIAAGLTAAAAHEAVAARIRATDEEARRTQEAIACKEAEVKALEEALAQGRAKKEAEERAHAEATAKAQADAAKKDAIEAARRKVAEERAKTEAELATLEAEKARLQRAREAEAARAREEAEARAAAATPPQWRKQRPNSAARLPREDHVWRPFESFSKGTPPPR